MLHRVGRWVVAVLALSACSGRCERELRSRLGDEALRDVAIGTCKVETVDDDTRIYSLEAMVRTKLSTAEVAARLGLSTRELRATAVRLAKEVGELTVKEESGEIVDGAVRFDGHDWIVLKKVASEEYRLTMRGVPQYEGE